MGRAFQDACLRCRYRQRDLDSAPVQPLRTANGVPPRSPTHVYPSNFLAESHYRSPPAIARGVVRGSRIGGNGDILRHSNTRRWSSCFALVHRRDATRSSESSSCFAGSRRSLLLRRCGHRVSAPLLQEPHKQRHPHRSALDGGGGPARLRGLQRGDRERMADRDVQPPHRHRGQDHLRGVLLHHGRPRSRGCGLLLQPWSRQRGPARARQCRCLPLRRERRLPQHSRERNQLLRRRPLHPFLGGHFRRRAWHRPCEHSYSEP